MALRPPRPVRDVIALRHVPNIALLLAAVLLVAAFFGYVAGTLTGAAYNAEHKTQLERVCASGYRVAYPNGAEACP